MPEYGETTSAETTSSEVPKRGQRDATKWHVELQIAEKELRKFWERGRKVSKRYMDEADNANASVSAVASSKYNIYWSNVGVLRSSLYANPPKPLVKRRFDDFMDDVARVAALMMERLLRQGFDKPHSDMQVAFCGTVEDRLIPGLGQIWLRYCPEVVVGTDEDGDPVEDVENEYVETDYVYWEDFLWSPARNWKEVRWVARRLWMTRKQFTGVFGKSLAGMVTWTKRAGARNDRIVPELFGEEQTEVFEIWNRVDRKVCFVSKNCDYYLKEEDDPLELEDFFPCPEPLLATHTTSSLVPKADYLMVQTQYQRLDRLEVRIGLLEDAVRAAGVYNKDNGELSQLLGNAPMNVMIPVENWGMFAEKGGMKGAVDWFPLEVVVTALDKLREVFNEEKVKLYELTGISDIMRGSTSPRETYGAQRLKAQYSSVRLQYMQNEVAKFVQAGLRIKAEIITKHFKPENIIKNSLIEYTPDAEFAIPAAQLLKDEWAACYRIEVHADTLAIPDFQAEQTARIEFISAVGQFLSQAVPLIQMAPNSATHLVRILQWGVASFRSAQSIEGVFDKAARELELQMKQPAPPPPPDPALIKAEAGAKKDIATAGKLEVETALLQQEGQGDQVAAQNEIQADNARAMADIQRDNARASADIRNQQMKTQADIEATQQKTAANIVSIRSKSQAQAEALRNRPKAEKSK